MGVVGGAAASNTQPNYHVEELDRQFEVADLKSVDAQSHDFDLTTRGRLSFMHEDYSKRPHPETIVLDIGDGTGALIIYTSPELHGEEIEVSPKAKGPEAKRVHTDVLERRIGNTPAFTAVFASLAEGEYKIWAHDPSVVDHATIRSGEVAEVDWRR